MSRGRYAAHISAATVFPSLRVAGRGLLRLESPLRTQILTLTEKFLKGPSEEAGMEIPDDPELEADLTGLQYGFSTKQQIQLGGAGRNRT